jgi:hypothetical protein
VNRDPVSQRALFFGHMALSLWDSYGQLRAGNINENSRGRWHINICVKARRRQAPRCADATGSVGIYLRLKDSPRGEEGACACGSCKDKELLKHQLHMVCTALVEECGVHLHWQCERFGASDDPDGKVCARRCPAARSGPRCSISALTRASDSMRSMKRI